MNDAFAEEVYRLVEAIPAGKVLTYGEIAVLLGRPRHARLVGRVLSQTPPERRVPCHRVVNARGETAPGWREQKELLRSEKVQFRPDGRVDRKRSGWRPWAQIAREEENPLPGPEKTLKKTKGK